MALTDKQITALLAPLDAGRVRQVQGNAHLEAWDIRRWLLRIFGWGGWQFDVVSCDLVSERSNWDEANPLKGRHSVVYRVVGRLTLRDPQGNFVTSWEDGATGDSQNQPSLGDAHDGALKTAMSQALKRCAVNIGEAGGLPLYNGGRTVPVVGKSIAHEQDSGAATQEAVTHGELATERSTHDTESPASPAGVGERQPRAESPPSPPEDSLPLGGEGTSEDVEALRQRQIDGFRERAIAAGKERSRSKALQQLTRLNLDMSQAGVLTAATRFETGEPTTLGVLADEVIKAVSRTAPEQEVLT